MADTTKPRAATLVGAMVNRVELSWSGASDNVGVARYEAWDNGPNGDKFLRTLDRDTRRYTTPPLEPGVHKLRIVTYDAAGNLANSNTVEVTILRGASGGDSPTTVVSATTAMQSA